MSSSMTEKHVCVVTTFLVVMSAGKAFGQTYNSTFMPWTVMGPVNTSASGYAVLNYSGDAYNYEVYLNNIHGLKSIELHVAAPGTHGDVVAVLYAAGSTDPSQVSNGLVAKGSIVHTDFVGPMLLPLGQHLDPSVLQTKFVETGNIIVIVHTLGNPGGELGAQILPGVAMTTCRVAPSVSTGA